MGRPRLSTSDPVLSKRRAAQRESAAARRARKRPRHQQIIAEFLSHPCVDCGAQYPLPAMHPDHVKPRRYKVAWYRDGNGTEETLREELSRCVVRCANCHCIRHAVNHG